nr:rho GTPase-activating protein gacV-like [Vicugna pacos]
MSVMEKQDLTEAGQDRADSEADHDPGLAGVPVVTPAEESDEIVLVAAFLVSQAVAIALQEAKKGSQEAAQTTVEEDRDTCSAEQEEGMEEGQEEEKEEQDYVIEEEEDEDEGEDCNKQFKA